MAQIKYDHPQANPPPSTLSPEPTEITYKELSVDFATTLAKLKANATAKATSAATAPDSNMRVLRSHIEELKNQLGEIYTNPNTPNREVVKSMLDFLKVKANQTNLEKITSMEAVLKQANIAPDQNEVDQWNTSNLQKPITLAAETSAATTSPTDTSNTQMFAQIVLGNYPGMSADLRSKLQEQNALLDEVKIDRLNDEVNQCFDTISSILASDTSLGLSPEIKEQLATYINDLRDQTLNDLLPPYPPPRSD